MAKDYKDEVINHLGFLGYEIEDLKVESGYTYVARSSTKSTLMVRIFNNVTILIARYSGYPLKVLKSKDFFEVINSVNQTSISKWYFEEDKEDKSVNLAVEGNYYDYNKVSFGSFVEGLEGEIQNNLHLFSKFISNTGTKK